MKLDIIYNEDFITGSQQRLPDKSINLIIADPPYNIGKADWDKIPDYINWCGEWLLECQRVLKDNGSFYLFHNDFLQIVGLQNWIGKNTNFIFKQFIIWNKYFKESNNEGFCKRRLSNFLNRNYYGGFTEYILFYTLQDDDLEQWIFESRKNIALYLRNEMKKSGLTQNEIRKRMELNMKGGGLIPHWIGISQPSLIPEYHYKTMQKVLQKKNDKLLLKDWIELKNRYENSRILNNNIRYTFNNQRVMVNNFNNQNWNNNVWNYEIAERVDHPSPKPISLIKNILKHSSNKGDTVLIPFIGSGNDCIACKQLSRHCIGFEISKEYCQLARKRLAQQQLNFSKEKF